MPATEAVLADAFGPVRVVGRQTLAQGRGLVERLTLEGGPAEVGPTVIVKRRDADNAIGAFESENLATEAAVLGTLECNGVDVGPRLLAGGVDDGVLVIEDLGARTVESVLFGTDAGAAEAALVQLAVATGRLHACRYHAETFASIGTWTIATRDPTWGALVADVARLGLPPPPPAASEEQAEVDAALRAPGPAVALGHGDITPANSVLCVDGRCRFVDFEGAGHHHRGLDACMLRFPFAWYGRWALAPASVLEAMERAYRQQFDGDRQEPATRGEHDRVLAVGCLAMALLRLERLPRIGAANQPPDVALRRRVQIVATLDVAVEVATAAGVHTALAGWLADMADSIRRRWVEANEPPPMFPAFRTVSR